MDSTRRQWPALAVALVHAGLLLPLRRELLSGATQLLVLLVVRLLLSLRRQWPTAEATLHVAPGGSAAAAEGCQPRRQPKQLAPLAAAPGGQA